MTEHTHDRPQPRWRRILAIGGDARVRPLWVMAAVLMGLLSLSRGLLLIGWAGALQGTTAGTVARCLLVGMRYDAVAVGAIMILPILLVALWPARGLPNRWFRRAVAALCALAATVIVIVEIVGAYFLQYDNNRLNNQVFDYIGHFDEPGSYILETYPVWAMPIVIVVSLVGFVLLFRRLLWPPAGSRSPVSGPWPLPLAVIGRAAWAGALVSLCALAIRGSLGHHRMRRGPAWAVGKGNAVVSQLTLSNLFTLSEAARAHFGRMSPQEFFGYDFPDAEEAFAVARDMLAQDRDTFLNDPANPLWRRTDTQLPQRDWNVVVIVMEGFAGRDVGALGHGPSLTPNFDAMVEDGIFFERMYAVADRTSHGLLAILGGHPDLHGESLLKTPRTQGKFLTLPRMLKQRGYRTLFVYGGDPDFDNMEGFFRAGGIDRVVDGRQMAPDQPRNTWGTHDEGVYAKADEVFRAQQGKFFGVVLTISNHEPYRPPPGRVDLLPVDNDPANLNAKNNAFRYSDWALGEFFKRARTGPYFKNTLFVLVPDQERTATDQYVLDIIGFHAPCLLYAPGLVPPKRIRSAAGQMDIPPTVMALLGGSFEHCFLGRNMLAVDKDDPGFAFIRNDRRIGVVSGDRALLRPPAAASRLRKVLATSLEPIVDEGQRRTLQKRMLSYYLAAWQAVENGGYDRPAAAQGP